MSLPIYPFDSERAIGTVIDIAGNLVKVNLPRAAAPGSRWHHGHKLEAGRVGEFVVVESGDTAVFGRVVGVRLPERERLSVEEELGASPEVHPIGQVSLIASARLTDGQIEPGVPSYPRLGARCFAAHPILIKWLAESSGRHAPSSVSKLIRLATLPFAQETDIRVTPESLFGRHCAILGTTGGGKSWTVARIVQEASSLSSKILLIDATGEYHPISGDHVLHCHVNKDKEADSRGSIEVCLPFKRLHEADLFALFQPSPQSQAPKLRAAIKSLKVLHRTRKALDTKNSAFNNLSCNDIKVLEAFIDQCGATDLVKKADRLRQPYEDASRLLSEAIDRPSADFEISSLAQQVQEECVWPAGQSARADCFGGLHQTDLGYCVNLITRIEQLVSSSDLSFLFRPEGKQDFLTNVLHPFLEDHSKSLLILSLKELSFGNYVREILVNAIGRVLLTYARNGNLKQRPLVVILDEAHQFIGKTLGEESSRLKLDSFELIAKEGRKYSLTICLATQRPRDIGQGILSQMGAFLVHRLTNPEDREIVERAAGDLDRSAAAFIPTLSAGHAVLIGTDFPIPVTLKIIEPAQKPSSSGPKYQESW
jgi:hypothetical protein